MKLREQFSAGRWWAIVRKEFLQLRRDRITFAMIVAIPFAQLILFGYAINSDPKHQPLAVISEDESEFTRSLKAALVNSSYFDLKGSLQNEAEADAELQRGRVVFVLHIPAGFTRALLRGEKPSLLMEADATDPSSAANALAALQPIVNQIVARDLHGAAVRMMPASGPYDIRLHRRYNPEGISQYNIVPGLMGVILTLMMVMMTGLAMTRERERGTMENLLATPALPIEVMSGKITPYIAIGVFQASLILGAGKILFHVPFFGSLWSVYVATLLFVAANLTVGITLSSLAQNQLQAMQMTVFYFMPNLLLSGFMFPFNGMPVWAQRIGNLLPLTHFNRLIRGILLKGSSGAELWPSLWPLMLFTCVVMAVAVRFYKRTLD